MTSSRMRASMRSSSLSNSSCWVETTMVSMRSGMPASLYWMVTWLFASGRRYVICLPSLRISAKVRMIRCARSRLTGIRFSVSLVA